MAYYRYAFVTAHPTATVAARLRAATRPPLTLRGLLNLDANTLDALRDASFIGDVGEHGFTIERDLQYRRRDPGRRPTPPTVTGRFDAVPDGTRVAVTIASRGLMLFVIAWLGIGGYGAWHVAVRAGPEMAEQFLWLSAIYVGGAAFGLGRFAYEVVVAKRLLREAIDASRTGRIG